MCVRECVYVCMCVWVGGWVSVYMGVCVLVHAMLVGDLHARLTTSLTSWAVDRVCMTSAILALSCEHQRGLASRRCILSVPWKKNISNIEASAQDPRNGWCGHSSFAVFRRTTLDVFSPCASHFQFLMPHIVMMPCATFCPSRSCQYAENATVTITQAYPPHYP